MLITINYIIISLYSVNCLQTVKLVEYDNKSKSDDLSDEKKVMKVDNDDNSNENEILTSCSSDSVENNPINSEKKANNFTKKIDKDNLYQGKILNSHEETRRLWDDTHKTSRDHVLIESWKNNFYGDRVKDIRDNLNVAEVLISKKKKDIYPEKLLTMMTREKEVSNNANIYPYKIITKTTPQTQRTKNIFPEKMINSYAKTQKDSWNITSIELSPYMEIDEEDQKEIATDFRMDKQQSSQNKNPKTLFKSGDARRKEDETNEMVLENKRITKTRQSAVSCNQNSSDEEQINTKSQYKVDDCTGQKGQQNMKSYKDDEVPTSSAKAEMSRSTKIDRRRKWSKSNSIQSPVSRNTTIEASDHDYQESMGDNEYDDEDQSSLLDYPYTVSVQRKGAHYASGALVGERWVLSTAAEFYNVRETIKLFRIRLGSVDCKKGGVIIPIKNIMIHPMYIPGQPSYDVALLRMAESVQFSSVIKPIGLSRVGGKVTSAKFLTTYWPRIVMKEAILPPSAKERVKYSSMRVSTQKLVPQELCADQMVNVNVTLDKNSLCLKPVDLHHSVCMPDVGAPVVAVDGLWGITSGWVSPLCPGTPLPTIFTRVSTHALRTWIDSQMIS